MAGNPGDPYTRQRLFAPGVGVLVGFVLLVGNPGLNRDLQISLSDSDSALRLVYVLASYPAWLLDADRFGPFLFWGVNLRTALFVGLAIAGLGRISRWLRETTGAMGVFVATVGVIALSAVVAGLTAETIVTVWFGSPSPLSDARDITAEAFVGQLRTSASFGVLFGLVMGAVVIVQRSIPPIVTRPPGRAVNSRGNEPKSFW